MSLQIFFLYRLRISASHVLAVYANYTLGQAFLGICNTSLRARGEDQITHQINRQFFVYYYYYYLISINLYLYYLSIYREPQQKLQLAKSDWQIIALAILFLKWCLFKRSIESVLYTVQSKSCSLILIYLL